MRDSGHEMDFGHRAKNMEERRKMETEANTVAFKVKDIELFCFYQ